MNSKLNKALKTLGETLWSIENKEMFIDFLEDIMTPKEISELKERIEICKMLKKGMSQREVADKLGVSITTVNRGSRILKWGTGAVNETL